MLINASWCAGQVHNRIGCVLNKAGKGKLRKKKGFMYHGSCE